MWSPVGIGSRQAFRTARGGNGPPRPSGRSSCAVPALVPNLEKLARGEAAALLYQKELQR